MMPKYRVHAAIGGSKYLGEFEAATPEDASRMAIESDSGRVSLCHQCSDQCEDPDVLWTEVVDEAGVLVFSDDPNRPTPAEAQ